MFPLFDELENRLVNQKPQHNKHNEHIQNVQPDPQKSICSIITPRFAAHASSHTFLDLAHHQDGNDKSVDGCRFGKRQTNKQHGVNFPLASGCRATASTALPVASPMPIPAPTPVKTAKPTPIAIKASIFCILQIQKYYCLFAPYITVSSINESVSTRNIYVCIPVWNKLKYIAITPCSPTER